MYFGLLNENGSQVMCVSKPHIDQVVDYLTLDLSIINRITYTAEEKPVIVKSMGLKTEKLIALM